jgi:transmembrane sensor
MNSEEFNNKSIEHLAKKWLDGTISEEEKVKYDSWYHSFEKEEDDENCDDVDFEKNLTSLRKKIKPKKSSLNKTIKLVLIPIAACLLVGFFVFKVYNRNLSTENSIAKIEKVLPGTNRAVLKLSNGKEISLEEVSSGKLANEQGITIVKNKNGEILYNISNVDEPNAETNSTNTITVPVGGTWKVQLPDGTKVWLNSLSSLTYPTNFNNKKERVVSLVGEAYFEVFKNEKQHFIVNSLSQKIEVLGTHFNINAYPNNNGIYTTLIEGSISVSAGNSSNILKPGEQSIINSANEINVSNVETDYAIAWKEGYFMFNYQRMEDIMKQLERWYGVTTIYNNQKLKNLRLFGNINKYENINKVIDMLNKAKMFKINIDGKQITINENN